MSLRRFVNTNNSGIGNTSSFGMAISIGVERVFKNRFITGVDIINNNVFIFVNNGSMTGFKLRFGLKL